MRRGRLAHLDHRPQHQVSGPVGGEDAGYGLIRASRDAAEGEFESRTVPTRRKVVWQVHGDLEVRLNRMVIHHPLVGHLEVAGPVVVPARVSLHREPGGGHEGGVELVVGAVGTTVGIEERAWLEAASQIDRGGVEIRGKTSGGHAQGARCGEGITRLKTLRRRLPAAVQVHLQSAGQAASHQVRPAVVVQIARGWRRIVVRPGRTVRLGQEREGAAVIFVGPYPAILNTDQQVWIQVTVQIGQEGRAVVLHVNAPIIMVGGGPGGAGRRTGVFVEVEATVFAAHQQVVVAVTVQVAKGRFGVAAHVEALIAYGGQHPVGISRRAKVGEEVQRAVVLADEQVQVAIVVNVHQRRRSVVQVIGVNGGHQAGVRPSSTVPLPTFIPQHADPLVIIAYQQVKIAITVPVGQDGGGVAAQVQRAGVIGSARPDGGAGSAQVGVGADGAIRPAQEHVQVSVLVQVGKGRGQFAAGLVDVGVLVGDQGPGRRGRGAVVAPMADLVVGANEEVQVAVVIHVGQGRQGRAAHAGSQVIVGDEHP